MFALLWVFMVVYLGMLTADITEILIRKMQRFFKKKRCIECGQVLVRGVCPVGSLEDHKKRVLAQIYGNHCQG